MSGIAKPNLRGHLNRFIIKSVVGAFIFASINCTIFYFGYLERRRKAFAEFGRTYNPTEHIKLLKKYGYLDSAKKK